jgi:hypothetical protein
MPVTSPLSRLVHCDRTKRDCHEHRYCGRRPCCRHRDRRHADCDTQRPRNPKIVATVEALPSVLTDSLERAQAPRHTPTPAARSTGKLPERRTCYYCTSLARRRPNSASLIDPAFFSRSSFSISSAALKPKRRLRLLKIALCHASSLKDQAGKHGDFGGDDTDSRELRM